MNKIVLHLVDSNNRILVVRKYKEGATSVSVAPPEIPWQEDKVALFTLQDFKNALSPFIPKEVGLEVKHLFESGKQTYCAVAYLDRGFTFSSRQIAILNIKTVTEELPPPNVYPEGFIRYELQPFDPAVIPTTEKDEDDG